MRNMIFKTLFASILGSLFIAPFAHADRQGGGTLRAISFSVGSDFNDTLNAVIPVPSLAHEVKTKEWVRFKGIEGDKVIFDYSWVKDLNQGVEQVSLDKAELTLQSPALKNALVRSKENELWVILPSENL